MADEERSRYLEIISELQTANPVQYVLGEAWFFDMKFHVDKNTLIPRPETEELVEWIISNVRFPVQHLKILDIGSGSGCIPVALSRKLNKAEVWSCDSSEAALTVASTNANNLGALVKFLHLDFLNSNDRQRLPQFDMLVSNPPYIPQNERAQLHANVANFEPSLALFVPDNDPLLFYKAIAAFGKTNLIVNGTVFVEIHERYARAVESLFISENYQDVTIKKDMQDKERMLKATYR
jgi:release factor glutamine methyltransferase